jgi:hypothetical protein
VVAAGAPERFDRDKLAARSSRETRSRFRTRDLNDRKCGRRKTRKCGQHKNRLFHFTVPPFTCLAFQLFNPQGADA